MALTPECVFDIPNYIIGAVTFGKNVNHYKRVTASIKLSRRNRSVTAILKCYVT